MPLETVGLVFYLFLVKSFALDWYEHATFYQVYPRSFQDSNGDGIGDLKGIISRIDHLKGLGVTAIWLSPPFKSPNKDFGYDVSDFYDINEEYGSLNDFDELVDKFHKADIKVLLDFIPNHSSDENEWFTKSINGVEEFKDFYVWHIGKKNSSGHLVPPNNWISVFGGSAWSYNDKRKMFYLHQFTKHQPDLNYRNPKMRQEMEKVFRFWMNRGCDGFRLDAINHMYEDVEFRDEPKTGWTEDESVYDYLDHIYTKDMPEVYDLVYDWRDIMDVYSRKSDSMKILMTEAYASIDNTMLYYQNANGSRQGAHMPFNFQLIYTLENVTNSIKLKEGIDFWLNHMPPKHTASWVVGSHDHKRVATRIGENRVDQANTLVFTLPGTSISYYGEEIGMTDYNEALQYDNRDPNRTPMQWNDSKQAGFTNSSSPWLKINPNYTKRNVAVQTNAKRSYLYNFKSLSQLRKLETFVRGDFFPKTIGKNLFAFTRQLEGHPTFAVVLNLVNDKQMADLSVFVNLPERMNIVAVGGASQYEIGDTVEIKKLILENFDSIVLQSQSVAVIHRISVLLIMASIMATLLYLK